MKKITKLINYLQTHFFFFLLFFFYLHYSALFSLSFYFRWHSSHSLSYFCFSLIIELSSPWLISMSANAWGTKVLMLSSLLLANIKILSCSFFFFLVITNNFLLFLLLKKKRKKDYYKCIASPVGAPTRLPNEMIQILLLVRLKTINILSM